MVTGRPPLIVGFLVACCVSLPAAQAPLRYPRGQSVFVVAVRNVGDAHAFEGCMVGAAPVMATRAPDTGWELVPSGVEAIPGALTDTALRTTVEGLLRKFGRFNVVPTVEQADLVLIVQGLYEAQRWGPSESFSGAGYQLRVTHGFSPGERPRDMLRQILAMAVPRTAWESGARSAETLLAARVWEGVETGGLRVGDGDKDKSASPDALVKAFSRNPSEPYGHTAERVPDRTHWTLCAVPQPPRAVLLPPVDPAQPPVPPLTASTPAASSGGSSGVRFTSGVLAVGVPIVARSAADNAPLSNVRPSDFRVYQDGTEQRVAQLLTEAEPLNAVLLLDSSESMRARFANLREAAASFIDALRPEDAVMVASFSGRTYLHCEPTRDRSVALEALLRMRSGGTTSRLFDAIDVVLAERLASMQGRKVMIVMTDGLDVDSGWATASSVLERLQASDVPVYVLQCDTTGDGPDQRGLLMVTTPGEGTQIVAFPPPERGGIEEASRFLANVAQVSGGRVVRAAMPDEIARVLGTVAEEVRHQYLLYYYPPNMARDGTFHAIRVESTRAGVVIRTKAGYLAR